ncbi:MAG: hypothetical protein ABR507_00050, partial [Actinomycetota bacterium]
PRASACLIVVLALISIPFSRQEAGADRVRSGRTTLVSSVPEETNPAFTAGDGARASISADGRYVAFESVSRLDPEDTDSVWDIYRRDMLTGMTELVSIDLPGEGAGWYCHVRPSISADGSRVGYIGGGMDLLNPGACRPSWGWIRYMDSRRISSVLGLNQPYLVDAIRLSGDGVAAALKLTGWNESEQQISLVGVWNVATATQRWIYQIPDYLNVGSIDISNDGRIVVFDTPDDTTSHFHDRDTDNNGIFDEATGTATSNLGVSINGVVMNGRGSRVSADGKFAVFIGTEDPQTEGQSVYVRNLNSPKSTRVANITPPSPATHATTIYDLAISADGRFVAFSSYLPLVASDTNAAADVYVKDRISGLTALVSVLPDETQSATDSKGVALSSNATAAAFSTEAPQGAKRSTYLRDFTIGCDIACLDPIVGERIDQLNLVVGEEVDRAKATADAFVNPPRVRRAPYDSSTVCAVQGTPTPNTGSGTLITSPGQSYCWYNDKGQSQGLNEASRPIYGLLSTAGWDFIYLPPWYGGYFYAINHSELRADLDLPAQGQVTVTAHMSGAITTTLSQFSNRFRGCLVIRSKSTNARLAFDCFSKDQGVRDLTVALTSPGTSYALVYLDLTGDIGQASVLVRDIQWTG